MVSSIFNQTVSCNGNLESSCYMDYFNIYKDVWEFHKKYQQVHTSDEYWKAVANESSQISKRYGECKFVINLLLAVVDELERIYKEMRANANTGI